MNAERYDPVNEIWKRALPALPALTRDEAGRAARALYRKFMTRDNRLDPSGKPERRKFRGDVRRVWIANRPGNNSENKGWPRLVHDVSHRVFSYRYPNLNPHHSLHARVELELTEHVVASGWLDGKLKPTPKAKPTTEERRAARRSNLESRLARWLTKQAGLTRW
jgi:hypothetical protein